MGLSFNPPAQIATFDFSLYQFRPQGIKLGPNVLNFHQNCWVRLISPLGVLQFKNFPAAGVG